ncbi:helix-turn-helix transcriptional regulator [Ramlibacter sp. AN1133]|uniref:helix-turn-helix transcriptional regulator n=1 Tax=Ramlibacter sp. AN1133 TaxID=3133429 RepID=UPI0030C51D47
MEQGDDNPQAAFTGRLRGGATIGMASADHPILRIPAADLDALMSTIQVRQTELEECTLRNERRLQPCDDSLTRLYYGISGSGSLTTPQGLSIAIAPNTLVVIPPADKSPGPPQAVRAGCATLTGRARILCGRFHAAFGGVVDMFGGLSTPIVERFPGDEDLQTALESAVGELQGQQPGSVAMASLHMKLAIVLLLRRSLTSSSPWVERFAILRDHRIAKAFAEMTARPGAAHTVDSLARVACLGRSTFMARFYELVGRAPMSVLRDLRMRQAAEQLRVTEISIGQIGQSAGYANNSGFIRAFRKAYGMEPREYRGQAASPGADLPKLLSDTETPTKESRSC